MKPVKLPKLAKCPRCNNKLKRVYLGAFKMWIFDCKKCDWLGSQKIAKNSATTDKLNIFINRKMDKLNVFINRKKEKMIKETTLSHDFRLGYLLALKCIEKKIQGVKIMWI